MKIRNKITLLFISLIALLQLVIFIFIYILSDNHKEKEFYARLKQRANIAAQAYLGKDELSAEIYEDIRTKHLQILPNEVETIIKLDSLPQFLAGAEAPPNQFIDEIIRQQYAEFSQGETYNVGLLYHDNQGDFIVILSAEDVYGKAKLEDIYRILLLAFVLSIFVVFFLGHYYAKQALDPIAKMIKRANSITATNLHLRLDAHESKDELSEMAKTFNDLLDRLEAAFDLQGNFINNASHELRNPLAGILGQTEIALTKDRTPSEYQSILQHIQQDAFRLDALVNGLLRLAQADFGGKTLTIEPIRVDELLLDVKSKLDQAYPGNRVVFDFDQMPQDEKELLTHGNYNLLSVSLSNILDNACKFSENEKVLIKLIADEQFVKVIVIDRGIGIPQEEVKNIFEPFYRGSNARGLNGFGFGLPLSYRIIKFHGGNIKVTSQIEKGTIVKISIPHENRFVDQVS